MTPMERPLSPHLQVYRPQITSVLSILHRHRRGADPRYAAADLVAGRRRLRAGRVRRRPGVRRLVVRPAAAVGFTFALFYHLGNGIRHLAWDFGWGFELSQVRASGLAVLAFAAAARCSP